MNSDTSEYSYLDKVCFLCFIRYPEADITLIAEICGMEVFTVLDLNNDYVYDPNKEV